MNVDGRQAVHDWSIYELWETFQWKNEEIKWFMIYDL